MIEHPEAERVDPIAGDVHAIWRDSHERYGARKIKAALERRGVTASRRRIVNIMKRRGMTSAYARRTFKPHKTRVNEARLANILDREFDGYEPRTHLASDLTYVRVGGKWAYVCLLIDLANRSIAGHSADTSRTADLVMAAFATLDISETCRNHVVVILILQNAVGFFENDFSVFSVHCLARFFKNGL